MTGTGALRSEANRWAAILVAVLGLLMVTANPAAAHGALDRSDPPNGGTVTEGRSTLTLWFSEPINEQASLFDLHTVDGVRTVIAVSTFAVDGGAFVEISTGELLRATYVLDWTVLSLEDGHPAKGSVIFGVGSAPVVVSPGSDRVPAASSLILRWADLMALMLTIGALTVSGRILDKAGRYGAGATRRTVRIGTYAATGAVLLGVITPLMRVPRSDNSLGTWTDTAWSTITATNWGRWWTAREIGLVLTAGILWWIAAHGRRTSAIRWGWATILAVAGIEGWLGHASTVGRQAWLVSMAATSHLVAAGVWAGGLTLLVVTLGPTMRRVPDSRGPLLSSTWRAFSPIALGATVVLAASGLYESGRHIADPSTATETIYGTTLIAKLILLAVGLALGATNTLLINPDLASRVGHRFGRSTGWAPISLRGFNVVVAIECLVLVAAVAAAGLLTSIPTATDLAAAAVQTGPKSANVDGLFLTYEVVPAGPGQSRVIVRTRSTVKPDPAPITTVEVTLTGVVSAFNTRPMDVIEDGRFEAAIPRLEAGSSAAEVVIHREGGTETVARFDWDTPANVERAGLFEWLTTSAAALLFFGAATLFAMKQRGRPVPAEPKQLVYGRQT